MPSTKSKTALVIAVALLLGVGTSLVAIRQFTSHRHAAPGLEGSWEGALSVQNMTLRLVLKVDKSPDGAYTATMDSVDQGAKDIPINTVTVSNVTVRFQLAPLQASYQGELNARVTEMSGQWRQGGMSLPLRFRRTTSPSTFVAALPSSAYARRQDSPLQGAWKGTLNAGGVPLRLLVKISTDSPGKLRGTMDSPDQGARNIPLTTIEFTQPTAQFDIASINGHFEGTLKADGSEIDGDWTQLGRSYRLLLSRTDPSEEATTPSASAYAYTSDTELQGIWNGTLDARGTKLRLTLKIARATDGSFSATMDSVDQGAKDIPATTVTFNDSDVELEWKALRALFHGTLEGGKLVGFWQQGPQEFPLDLERTNRVAATNPPKGKD